MNIQRHKPAARYSEAVIVNGLAFLSGQVPENTAADAQGQTADVLAQIDAVLTELGTDKRRLVDATVYLKDMADYAAMNAAWDAWVAPGCAPARATVQALLAKPEWKVEIKVVAAL